MDCKCDFREKMVGDGCEVCNPAKALEYAKETMSALEAHRDMLSDEIERLRATLLELADLCTEFCDHTPESWNRAVLELGNKARVTLTPNEQGERPPR